MQHQAPTHGPVMPGLNEQNGHQTHSLEIPWAIQVLGALGVTLGATPSFQMHHLEHLQLQHFLEQLEDQHSLLRRLNDKLQAQSQCRAVLLLNG